MVRPTPMDKLSLRVRDLEKTINKLSHYNRVILELLLEKYPEEYNRINMRLQEESILQDMVRESTPLPKYMAWDDPDFPRGQNVFSFGHPNRLVVFIGMPPKCENGRGYLVSDNANDVSPRGMIGGRPFNAVLPAMEYIEELLSTRE